MLTLDIPVIVEGKYDKSRLAQVVDAVILTTDGFGIFKNHEKTALIRRLGDKGVVLLCDSDGAGKVIRSYLKGILPPDRIYDLYTPQIRGVEKRKRATGGSREGFLGVEGMDNALLLSLFERLAAAHPEILGCADKPVIPRERLTKGDMYTLGLTGGVNAALRRDQVCGALDLPAGMNANAFLSAVNLLHTRQEILALCARLWQE